MAAVVTYDQERTQEIVDGVVTNGSVNGSKHLILNRHDGGTIDAGNVEGPEGFQGPELPHIPGHISLYAGTTAPMGWLICDGSIISRDNFPELFAAIGTTYGSGDGSTTFHIPDLRGRVPVGKDATQTEFDTLGERGGEKAHVLTIDEMPAHTHTMLGYKGIDDQNFTGNVGRMQASDTATPYNKETLNTGGGAAHNNLQPYNTLNYIIAIGKAAPQGGGIAKARYFTDSARGTTAQRDAKYGVPGTAAARVALANQQVTWYNTDLGWKERYYEVTASSGLTAIGLVAGATAGWYPINEGPYIELNAPVGDQSIFFNTFITGWVLYGRKGGASWFTLNGTDRVDVLKHGRYDIQVYTTVYAALNGVAPDFSLQLLGTDNTTVVRGTGGGAFKLDPNFNLRPHQELLDQIILPNQKIGWKLQKGTMPAGDTTMMLHGGGPSVEHSRMKIRYIAPPLSDIQ